MSKDIAKIVTDRIIAALEAGIVPWRKPWKASGMPRSVHGHRYRGINVLLLTLASMTEGYTSPFWATYKQIQERGWHLKDAKGKGVHVVLWKPVKPKASENEEGDTDEPKPYLLLRYFTVFNLDLVEGEDLPVEETLADHDEIEQARSIVAGMPNPPQITHGGDRAFYSVPTDAVRMSPMGAFEKAENYYATMFHELAHATGHETRLSRSTLTEQTQWGGQTYAQEELVAEISSAMLCAEAGIEHSLEQSAAYCRSWLRWAEDNRRAIISAAAQAQKAADFILDVVEESEEA